MSSTFRLLPWCPSMRAKGWSGVLGVLSSVDPPAPGASGGLQGVSSGAGGGTLLCGRCRGWQSSPGPWWRKTRSATRRGGSRFGPDAEFSLNLRNTILEVVLRRCGSVDVRAEPTRAQLIALIAGKARPTRAGPVGANARTLDTLSVVLDRPEEAPVLHTGLRRPVSARRNGSFSQLRNRTRPGRNRPQLCRSAMRPPFRTFGDAR